MPFICPRFCLSHKAITSACYVPVLTNLYVDLKFKVKLMDLLVYQ